MNLEFLISLFSASGHYHHQEIRFTCVPSGCQASAGRLWIPMFASFSGGKRCPKSGSNNYAREESQGKIIHLVSCQTALKLGPDFVLHGCKAFFGYDADFTFFMDTTTMFFQCDSEIDRAFADGLTAADVYTRIITLFNQNISALRAQGSNYKAAAMESNRAHLRPPARARNGVIQMLPWAKTITNWQ